MVNRYHDTVFMQVKIKLKGHSERITGLAFSPALKVLVSSGADGQVSSICSLRTDKTASSCHVYVLGLLICCTSFHAPLMLNVLLSKV